MDIVVEFDKAASPIETRVGNVYNVRGGRGASLGHMMVLIAITEAQPRDCRGPSALMLVVTKEGDPVGVTSYGLHYLDDKCPIAFADGVEDINLRIRSL